MDLHGLYTERDMEPNDKDPDQLDLEMAEKELQLLTKKQALQRH
jgi:hypothetical protein